MTIPLARITHLETAIRRRRMQAIRYNSKRMHESVPAWRAHYARLYWDQMYAISGLFQALYRSRTVAERFLSHLPQLS